MEAVVQTAGLIDAAVFNATGLLLVVLGVFVLIRITSFPDLTVDGSFTIGAALYSVALASGYGAVVALSAAIGGGGAGGFLTWAINHRLGVGKVVSGVLSMVILTLVAPYVSGGSTTGLLNVDSVFRVIDVADAEISASLLPSAPFQLHLLFSSLWLGAFFLIGGVCYAAFSRKLWLRVRYVGSAVSPTLVPVREQAWLRLLGLCTGNALIGLGGAIEAQRRGGYTNNMGLGMLLVALAVLVLGEALIKSYRKREFLWLSEYAIAIVIGSFLYAAAIQMLLALQLQVVDIRLLTAFFLLLLLGVAGRTHSSSTRLF